MKSRSLPFLIALSWSFACTGITHSPGEVNDDDPGTAGITGSREGDPGTAGDAELAPEAGSTGEHGEGGARGGTGPAMIGGSGGDHAQSPDGGSMTTPDAEPVVPANMKPAILAAGYGALRVVSFDEGATWTHRKVNDPNGGDDQNLIRAVGYGEGVWIGAGWKLFRSTDGKTWTELGADQVPGGWYDCVTYQNGQFIVKVIRADRGGQNGEAIVSDDMGKTWRRATSATRCPADPSPFRVGNALLRSAWKGKIERSIDGGRTWKVALQDCCSVDGFAIGYAVP